MRKLTAAMLATVAAMSLAACEKKAEETAAPAETAAATEAAADPSADPSAAPSEQTGPVERTDPEAK